MSQVLPFKLGDELYGLDVTEVQEVVESQVIYPLPGAPEVIVGAFSFHGRIMPVVDLPSLLDFPGGQRAHRLIVLTAEVGSMALQVDELQRIRTVNLEDETLAQSHSDKECIRGVINWQNQMINLLDLEQLQQRMTQICTQTGGHGE